MIKYKEKTKNKQVFYINSSQLQNLKAIERAEEKGIKRSDYINNAITFNEKNKNKSGKQEATVDDLDTLLPPLHKLFDLIRNVKHDYAEELLRLERNKKITLDRLTDIVLSIISLYIQFMKTETVKKKLLR